MGSESQSINQMASKADEKKEDPEDDQGGLDEETEVELQLKSQDMLTFKVNKDVVMQSALIKTMWSGDQTETEIPLPNVRGSILKKVIKYMQYHHTNPAKEIEKPLKSANMREVVSEWDANFVEVDQETLFDLIFEMILAPKRRKQSEQKINGLRIRKKILFYNNVLFNFHLTKSRFYHVTPRSSFLFSFFCFGVNGV